MTQFIQSLSPTLFWDVDRNDIDEDRHRRFIVQRVLERGTMEDWDLAVEKYTIPGIVAEAQQMRSLDPRSLSFIACVGDVPKESFRCYTSKQSNQAPWVY